MYFGYSSKEDLKDAVLAAAKKNYGGKICMDVFNCGWSTYECFNDLVCRVVMDSEYFGGDF